MTLLYQKQTSEHRLQNTDFRTQTSEHELNYLTVVCGLGSEVCIYIEALPEWPAGQGEEDNCVRQSRPRG